MPINMKTSDKGAVEIIGHEGIALTKYNDMVGKGYTVMPDGVKRKGTLTIGAGITATEIPDLDKWPWDKKITIEDAFALKAKAMKRYEDALNSCIHVEIPQHVFDALVSWCYNVGVGWTGKYGHPRATLIKRLNRGESLARVAEALLRFKKPRSIIGRRRKEAKLLEHGIYSNKGRAALIPVSKRGYPIYPGTSINVWEYMNKRVEEEPTPPTVTEFEEKKVEEPKEVKNYFQRFLDIFR